MERRSLFVDDYELERMRGVVRRNCFPGKQPGISGEGVGDTGTFALADTEFRRRSKSVPGRHLAFPRLHVEIGRCSVRVLDENGRPITDDRKSEEITLDAARKEVRFTQSLSCLAGRRVRLRYSLVDARRYSYTPMLEWTR